VRKYIEIQWIMKADVDYEKRERERWWGEKIHNIISHNSHHHIIRKGATHIPSWDETDAASGSNDV